MHGALSPGKLVNTCLACEMQSAVAATAWDEAASRSVKRWHEQQQSLPVSIRNCIVVMSSV